MAHLRPSRARRLRRSLAVLLAVLAIAISSIIFTTTRVPYTSPLAVTPLSEVRHQVVDNTNRLRVSVGLRPLKMANKLNAGAQDHSELMAKNTTLVHSTDLVLQMTQAYDGTWSFAGENIGVFGGALSELLTALRQSPEHRANMLKPQYQRIGVGAKWGGDRLWLTIWYEG